MLFFLIFKIHINYSIIIYLFNSVLNFGCKGCLNFCYGIMNMNMLVKNQSAFFKAKNTNMNVHVKNKSAFFKAKSKYILCCVKKCLSERNESQNLKFYKFPRNQILKKIWMENCKVNFEKGITNKFVCGKHFERKCLGPGKLMPYSIPTIFPYSIKNILPFLKNSPTKFRVRKCCVNECIGTNESGNMFRFPSQKSICDQWIEAFGFQANFETKDKFVCKKHFEKRLIQKQKLKKNSVPSLHLGNPVKVFNFTEAFENNVSPSFKVISSFAEQDEVNVLELN